uniref:SGNH hydrolase-type esterase domain-containing protein n=1 Tax=Knipowitschia caucasica TaxID=637954 RepID=A0AAV2M9E4_KNICA
MVARRWAKNSLPRIKPNTLDKIEDCILNGPYFKNLQTDQNLTTAQIHVQPGSLDPPRPRRIPRTHGQTRNNQNPVVFLDPVTLEDPETSTQEAENTLGPSNNSPTLQEQENDTGTPVRRRGSRVSFPQELSTQPPTRVSSPEPTTSPPGPSRQESRPQRADRSPAGSPLASEADPDLEQPSGSDEEEGGPNVYKIEKHKVTNRKSLDWSLRVTKPVLILGDSNVARIKDHTFASLQIDSFPGANLLHAAELLSNTPNQPQVESVVLSFGLNNRQQKQSETCIKQMQRLVREAKKTFPHANIRVPLIQSSKELPLKERSVLAVLNHHLERNMPHIRRLPEEDFRTRTDNIHWTEETAKKMLQHWARELNWDSLQ